MQFLFLCLQVSKGEKFLDFDTLKSEVLYLCLEGGEQRLSERLKLITSEPTENLFFTLKAKSLNFGFREQINEFIKKHKNTKLIVIDTWQKIRDANSVVTSYQNDYNEMQTLREIAEEHNICILLVHHTRKMQDDDPFNMITGTTGFTGAVDNMYVLIKENRLSSKAKLHMTGRDIKDKVLHLESEKESCEWVLTHTEDENTIEFPEDIFFCKVVEFMEIENEFRGTATELKKRLLKVCDYEISEKVVTKKLIKYKDFFALKDVNFFNTRNGRSRELFLKKMN